MISIKPYIRRETLNRRKQVNVRFRIYDKGLNLFYTTDIRIHPSLWNFDAHCYGLVNPYINAEYKMVNEKLNQIHTIIADICKNYHWTLLNSDFLKKEVNKELDRIDTEDDLLNKPFSESFRDYVQNHRMHESRRRYFKVILKSFLAFEKYLQLVDRRVKSITYNTINHKLLNQFADFIVNEKQLAERYPVIHNGEERNLGERCYETGDNYLRYLRCVINSVRIESGTDYYPMKNFSIKTPKVNKPIALTTAEIKQLYDFKTEDKVLELIRDNFLLQYCTVARVADFHELSYNHILYNSSEKINYTCFTPKKTAESSGKQVEVPYNNLARELILKYKGSSDLLIPHVSEQYYNRKLKELFELAGLDRTIVQYDKVQKMDVHKPLYSLVTSHIARKTAISRLYNAGCPLDLINDICGHVGDTIKVRYAEFDLATKLDYMNKLCPWYLVEQPLFDVKNDTIVENKSVENKKFIPFVTNRMVI